MEKRCDMSALDLMVSNGLLRLDAEALAALRATSREHGTAGLCGHTGTEAMALGALTGIGLVGAFHRLFPFIFKRIASRLYTG